MKVTLSEEGPPDLSSGSREAKLHCVILDLDDQVKHAQACAQDLAERLTQHGPADARYARNALIAAGVPVPVFVEREATGMDKEQEVKP